MGRTNYMQVRDSPESELADTVCELLAGFEPIHVDAIVKYILVVVVKLAWWRLEPLIYRKPTFHVLFIFKRHKAFFPAIFPHIISTLTRQWRY